MSHSDFSATFKIMRLVLASIFCVCSVAGLIGQASGQHCPISLTTLNQLDFSSVTKACGDMNSSEPCSRYHCLYSLITTLVPVFKTIDVDLNSSRRLSLDKGLVQACLATTANPLGAGEHGYSNRTTDIVADLTQPSKDVQWNASVVEGGKFHTEECASECNCSGDFNPVCDHNGIWYMNYCCALCKDAHAVERCTPIFKEIELHSNPFVLHERAVPISWRAGCYCSPDSDNLEPVCDIYGQQYTSRCYAECQGVTNVIDCRSLIIDFTLKGNRQVNVQPKVKTRVIHKPETKKANSSGTSSAVTRISAHRELLELPDEAAVLFQQLDLGVHGIPIELLIMAQKIILGDNINGNDLQRAREIFSDEEQMAELQSKLKPSQLHRLEQLGAETTENNKKLLNAFFVSVKQTAARSVKNVSSLQTCLQKCHEGDAVCSLEHDEYASACHARCFGLTEYQPCYYYDESRDMLSTPPVCTLLALAGTIVAMSI